MKMYVHVIYDLIYDYLMMKKIQEYIYIIYKFLY